MYRIDNSTASPTLPPATAPGVAPDSYFTDVGGARTIADAEWLNSVQEEISNVVDNDGALAPLLSKQARNQLLMGIRREVNSSSGHGGTTQPTLTYLTASVTWNSGVPLTPDVISEVCYIDLAPGNWLIWGHIAFRINFIFPTIIGGCVGVGQNTAFTNADTGLSGVVTATIKTAPLPALEFQCGCAVIQPTVATRIHLLARASFVAGGGGLNAYGFLAARAC